MFVLSTALPIHHQNAHGFVCAVMARHASASSAAGMEMIDAKRSVRPIAHAHQNFSGCFIMDPIDADFFARSKRRVRTKNAGASGRALPCYHSTCCVFRINGLWAYRRRLRQVSHGAVKMVFAWTLDHAIP